MDKVIGEIIAETLSQIRADLDADTLRPIVEYELEANSKLPEDKIGSIFFRIGLLDGQLLMGYQEI